MLYIRVGLNFPVPSSDALFSNTSNNAAWVLGRLLSVSNRACDEVVKEFLRALFWFWVYFCNIISAFHIDKKRNVVNISEHFNIDRLTG